MIQSSQSQCRLLLLAHNSSYNRDCEIYKVIKHIIAHKLVNYFSKFVMTRVLTVTLYTTVKTYYNVTLTPKASK